MLEAGFPASSEGDLNAVSGIAGKLQKTEVAALARTSKKDIDRAWQAISHAAKPRIHTFIATSDLHLEYKLQMSREQVLEAAVDAVLAGLESKLNGAKLNQAVLDGADLSGETCASQGLGAGALDRKGVG